MKVKCPNCENGTGGIPAHIRFAPGKEPKTDAELRAAYEAISKCRTCNGSGRVTQDHYRRICAGKIMRRGRIDKGYGLRQAAELIGMCPSLFSQMEKGEIEPDLSLLDRLQNRPVKCS